MLAAALLVVVAAYVAVVAVHENAANRALIDEMFKPVSRPPARLVVCEGVMDSACAQDAADRIGTTVAWLDGPAGYDLEWMFATANPVMPDEGVIATQYFVGEDGYGMFEVLTSVPPLPSGAPPQSRFVSNGPDRGSVWMDETTGIASVEWSHDGIKYVITAQPRPWDPSAVVEAWKTIHYTSPNSS